MHARMNAADALLSPQRIGQYPGRTAILFHDERIGYGDLLARVNRFGNGLAALGIERENRVLMMLQDSPDMVAAWLAAIKIGAVSVAVNVRSSAQDLLYFINDSRAKVLLIDAEFLPLYAAVAARVLLPLRVFVSGKAKALQSPADAGDDARQSLADIPRGQSDALEAAAMSPDDMAFWMYTSGTTGTSKAAVHRHRSVLSCLDFARDVLGATAKDVLFSSTKLFFAYANSNCLMASFTLGATTVLTDEWPDSATLARIIERHRPTMFFSVPTVYRNLLRDGFATAERFASIRRFVCAGERLPGPLLERWQSATGKDLIDALGTTETIFMILANRPGEIRAGSSGKPTPRTSVELRDADGTVIREPGKAGVLWVKMDALAERYWNQRARSNAAFAGPWFRTGDVYVADGDGYYFQEGRADDMLKISGQWVSPAEIEDEVLKLPLVADAAVVGAADADGLTRLSLFVVAGESGVSRGKFAARILDALRSRLPVYKCPRDIRVVDELPRTATGKVQRYKLREQAGGNNNGQHHG